MKPKSKDSKKEAYSKETERIRQNMPKNKRPEKEIKEH